MTVDLIRRSQHTALTRAAGGYIPHLSLDDVRAVAIAADQGRNGRRDKLMVQTLFDSCLRVSECISLRLKDLRENEHGWLVEVMGKGGKFGQAAVSPSLALLLVDYAAGFQPTDRFFPLDRSRVFQIIKAAMKRAGVRKPPGVGTVHVFRHSGAIERLRVTQHPRSLQDQLRHETHRTTLVYMRTLNIAESLAINQVVDNIWA